MLLQPITTCMPTPRAVQATLTAIEDDIFDPVNACESSNRHPRI